MNKLVSYPEKLINLFKQEHLIFFIIIVISLQLLDYLFFNRLNIKLFSPASIISVYCFINLQNSVYQVIMGSVVGTIIPYLVYEFFINTFKKIITVPFNLLTFISAITCMILLNCIFIPALAYSLLSYEMIPKSTFSYLSSLVSSSIVIVILSSLFLNIAKKINKNSPSITRFYQQLETNLSNK